MRSRANPRRSGPTSGSRPRRSPGDPAAHRARSRHALDRLPIEPRPSSRRARQGGLEYARRDPAAARLERSDEGDGPGALRAARAGAPYARGRAAGSDRARRAGSGARDEREHPGLGHRQRCPIQPPARVRPQAPAHAGSRHRCRGRGGGRRPGRDRPRAARRGVRFFVDGHAEHPRDLRGADRGSGLQPHPEPARAELERGRGVRDVRPHRIGGDPESGPGRAGDARVDQRCVRRCRDACGADREVPRCRT
jgi:hypothetical protein